MPIHQGRGPPQNRAEGTRRKGYTGRVVARPWRAGCSLVIHQYTPKAQPLDD